MESVCLKDEKIVRVESYLIDREFTPKKPLSKMNDNEVKECLDHWFAPPIHTPDPQYIKIKEFEPELCFLPWRVELDAIFKGNGYSRKR